MALGHAVRIGLPDRLVDCGHCIAAGFHAGEHDDALGVLAQHGVGQDQEGPEGHVSVPFSSFKHFDASIS